MDINEFEIWKRWDKIIRNNVEHLHREGLIDKVGNIVSGKRFEEELKIMVEREKHFRQEKSLPEPLTPDEITRVRSFLQEQDHGLLINTSAGLSGKEFKLRETIDDHGDSAFGKIW